MSFLQIYEIKGLTVFYFTETSYFAISVISRRNSENINRLLANVSVSAFYDEPMENTFVTHFWVYG